MPSEFWPEASQPSDGAKRSYARDSETNRREALIAATRALVAEGGPKAATVRAIAERAGVTAGLIRHYYGSKDALLRAAYVALVDGMMDKGRDALSGASADPAERLAAFVAAALRPPVMDPQTLGLWAGYMHVMQAEPLLLEQHEKSYLRYRKLLEELIGDLGREVSAAQLRQEAIACKGVLDGLWQEGSVLGQGFEPGELVRIGVKAIGAILEYDLTGAGTFVPELRQISQGG